MASPEDKDRKRRRMKNKYAKEVRTAKYRPKVVEDKTKKIELKDLTHAQLVKLIQENEDNGDVN